MSDRNSVLVMSIRSGGGVRPAAEIIRSLAMRPVLVSENPEDRNRDSCEDHIVVDWENDDLDALVDQLKDRGIRPMAVVNNLEPLIGWQASVLRHFALPLGDSGLDVLSRKLSVRTLVRDLGLSTLSFWGGPVGELNVADVDHYPVILKPSEDSGGSRFVHRADNSAELERYATALAAALSPQCEVVVEEYLDGIESSLDGPVLDGHFRPLLHIEKTDHNESRHHDAGLCISPPTDQTVRAATDRAVELIDPLCKELCLDNLWLHVEVRTRKDGRTELVEINTRPGGRLYRSAAIRTTGIDPSKANLLLALAESDQADLRSAVRNDELVALVVFDAEKVGHVRAVTTREDLLEIEGVVDAYVLDGMQVTSLDQENNVAEVLITADDLTSLRALERHVRRVMDYEVL